MAPEDQAGNAHYRDNPLDRGHLFRRADAAWGASMAAARRADADTFFWPNIAPQHEVFNQPGRDAEASLWGDIERHLVREAGDRRWTAMNGPVFGDNDPTLYGLRLPQAYYKAVAIADGNIMSDLVPVTRRRRGLWAVRPVFGDALLVVG